MIKVTFQGQDGVCWAVCESVSRMQEQPKKEIQKIINEKMQSKNSKCGNHEHIEGWKYNRQISRLYRSTIERIHNGLHQSRKLIRQQNIHRRFEHGKISLQVI